MSEQRIPERRRCPVCGNEGYMLDEPTVDNRIRQLEAENARLRRQVEAWEQAVNACEQAMDVDSPTAFGANALAHMSIIRHHVRLLLERKL